MGIWNDLLKSFESSRSPKKALLLLGGSSKIQNKFIEKLYIEEDSFLTSTKKNKIANEFGIGYTFIHFKDDSGELLSTVQVYTLPGDFKPHYKQLIESITSTLTSKDLLVVPILSYTENPYSWVRSLRSWLSTLHSIYYKDDNSEELQKLYKSKYKNVEEGVYTLPIGVDILIAVVNTETRPDWEHSIFEYIQFVLRIISLKHGSSLIYTSLLRSDPRIMQLISSILEIEVTHKIQPKLEPNLVDHTEVLVPAGVDSWGKIKTLNDDIDPSQLADDWELTAKNNKLVDAYEKIVPDLLKNLVINDDKVKDRVIEDISYQEFLTIQYDKEHGSQEKILKTFIQNVQSRTGDS